MSIIIIIITRIELNFVKHLRINISEKNLTHRFDVAMASLSSDKDKTKSWLNIYGLKWQNKEQSTMFARENEKMWIYVEQRVLPGLNKIIITIIIITTVYSQLFYQVKWLCICE